MRAKKTNSNLILFFIIGILVFINAYTLTKNEVYKNQAQEVTSQANDLMTKVQEDMGQLEKNNIVMNDMTGEIETLKAQVEQLEELKANIAHLEEENARLIIKQSEYDNKISSLESDSMKLYYPIFGDESHSLRYVEDLVERWDHIRDYKEGVYDCSETSAHLEWFLESNGVKAKIVEGQPSWADTNHAWVWAYGKFGKVAIEATTKTIKYYNSTLFTKADRSYYNDENVRTVYDNIHEVPDNWLDEYDWWNSKTQ